MSQFLEFLSTNVLHVLPIIVCGIFAVAIILERAWALYQTYPLRAQDEFFDRIRDLVMGNKVSDALALCERYGTKPVAQVVKRALIRAQQPIEMVEDGLELAVEEVTQRVQGRTAYLAMLANVATLLGLLGTIAGLVVSFNAIGSLDAQEKATFLAKGISQAMHATMMGLSVAVPCMVAFSFLMNRTNRLTSQIECAAVRVIDIFKQRFYESERPTHESGPHSDHRGAA